MQQPIAISLTPYQGLKLLGLDCIQLPSIIAISLTPYQGLKPRWEKYLTLHSVNCNFINSLSGIETVQVQHQTLAPILQFH